MIVRATFFNIGVSFVGLILTSVAYSQGLVSKAVAIWLFDEDGGKKVNDYARNHHDGEFEGKPEWVPGKFGSTVKFSGADENQWVDIERPVVVDTVDFSIVAGCFRAPRNTGTRMSSPVAMLWNRTRALRSRSTKTPSTAIA